jgi:hypothetical protein
MADLTALITSRRTAGVPASNPPQQTTGSNAFRAVVKQDRWRRPGVRNGIRLRDLHTPGSALAGTATVEYRDGLIVKNSDMSGDADGLQGTASNWTERGKARRFLLGIPVGCIAVSLLVLDVRGHVAGLVGLTFAILPVALFIGSVMLQRSRPQGMGKALTPNTLRRIARLAEVPELGTMIIVYGCIIVALSIPTLNLAAFYHTP